MNGHEMNEPVDSWVATRDVHGMSEEENSS